MNFEKKKENVAIAAQWLRENGYAVWFNLIRERSDPLVKAVFGTEPVGNAAYMIAANGEAYLVISSIDAQEGEESGVFTEVVKYGSGSFDETFQSFCAEKFTGDGLVGVINFSVNNALADGLKLGLWRRCVALLPQGFVDFKPSEPILDKLDLTV